MSSGGTRAGTRGKNYVLPLAIVLVVGQIAAFVAIKLMKDDPKKETPAQPAVAAADLGSGSAIATLDVPGVQGSGAPTGPSTGTTPPTTTETPPTAPDPAAAGQNPTPDEPVIDPSKVDDTIKDGDTEDAKRAKRELAKQKAAKDKAEKAAREKAEKAERAERDRREAEERRREAEAKRASDVEKARLAAEAEKARLAAEKAKAEAAAEQARLEQEKLKAEAAAKQVAATSTGDSAEKPKGSSKVLVLVLGPGVSHPSREAIRNVYLGKTSVWPNGTTAHPMNRPSGSAAGRKFFGGILGMSGGEFKEHWSELQLSGGGIAPSTVSSATTMIAKVAATRGGMGYVLESELPENTNGVTLVRLK